jgi:hypothetical protein
MSGRRVLLGDRDIRQALISRLSLQHAHEAGTVVIEELGVCRGQVRIDAAVVNGRLHGYEIKSDRDCLRRLEHQVRIYSRVLDQATLVVGDRHLADALHIVPDWWGVLHITRNWKGVRFKALRRGRMNQRRDPRALVELLWLEDALDLLTERNLARGVRAQPRRVVWDRICEYFSVDEISATVRTRLKARATLSDPAQLS